uniref:Uncharacterized protein n=1 Tax=Bosea sp. NBC_00436 TaxID=2969620 RepID=A0A9E7ZR90_9HYPH
MTKPTAAANAAGLPRIPGAPVGPLCCAVDMAALRAMTMGELNSLREALHTLTEVASAIGCQPRFSSDEDNCYNNAGLTLDSIYEFLAAYEQAVVNVAEVAQPKTSIDVEHRAWTRLGFQADMTDGLSSFAVLAAQSVRDEVEAKFREQHEDGVPR